MRYVILAMYNNNDTEEIDRAESLEDAQYLVSEYQLAYGAGWRIWYERI